MIVNNVITIIFVVITETAVVRCAFAASKHHLKIKTKEIGHTRNDDVLLHALSDFGVVRRSLNPMLTEQYSSIQYLKEEQNIPNVERKNTVLQKLKSAVTFRDNILYVFSYLLHGRENELTEEQYTTLQTLYEFLKKKMVYMYNLLPVLSQLDHITDKNQQTSVVLLALIKNLPPYIQCTAHYLANEIESKRINLNTLLKPTASETFNYLADIDIHTVTKGKIKDEEMAAYNTDTHITHKTLGPVFVKLLYNLQTKKQPLSQDLFGLMLMNLPNPSNDPVLEENIRFLYDITKNNLIERNNWDSIAKNLVGKDVYTLVFSILTNILNSNVQMVVKDATAYVYHHLKVITVPTHVNSNLKYMYHLLEKDIDVGMLLSAIVPQEFDSDAVRVKDYLLTYFMRNYKNEDMNKILKGFNKFAYNNPLDLLLAFLTRLINRVPSFPNTNSHMLQQPATALLPAVIMKKYTRIFTPFVSPEIDILILLESLKTPDADSILQSTVDSIKLELIAEPQISVLLSTLIPTEKDKCLTPKHCLLNTFQQIPKLQHNIPLTLTTKIQNIVYILKTTLQQQKQNFPLQYSIKPVDVNLYLDRDRDRENPISVAIETDTYTNNVPRGFNGVPYVWNIDKYVGKIGPGVQDESKVVTSEWETGIPTYIESVETKVVSPMVDRVQDMEEQVTKTRVTETKVIEPKVFETYVTERVPIQEHTDRPLTLKSSLTTSKLSNIPSLITHTPTQKPRKKLPQHATSERESIVEEYDEVEYIPEQIPELIFHDKETSRQPSISEESISETSPSEEITKEVMKTFTKVTTTTHAKPKLSPKVEKKMNNEKVSSAVVLPPTVETDQPLKVQISNSGVPVVTTSIVYNTAESTITLPEIKKLLETPDINNPMRDINSPIVTQVLQPLSVIFGKNYVKTILRDVDTSIYPTNIALLSAILKKAVTHPEVVKNSRLINLIHKYIVTIDYVSPTILLPIIVSSKKLVSDIVYSTFNPDDLTHGKLTENPPDEPFSGSVSVPLVNPKILLQAVNPSNPYDGLLPTLEKGDTLAMMIQPLTMILTSEKILEILGPDFQPLVYPNKLSLLITLLYKLQKSKTIQSVPKLKALVDMYIQAIEVPAMSIRVSEDNLVKMMSETTGQWQPELTSLTSALVTTETDDEITMQYEIERFLDNPTLLEKLHIPKPPLTMTRGDLLHKIILSALKSDTLELDKSLLNALRYYKDKVEFVKMGALPIMWMWVETYVVKAEVQLGNMIQETVDFNQLSYKEKLAYNDLITYLAENPNLLQDNEDFDFEKYTTQGHFIKGLFKHLLKKPQIDSKIKKNIQMILSRVSLTGRGAHPMPSFAGF